MMSDVLVTDLEATAMWRHSLTDRFPSDPRNNAAAEILEYLARDVAAHLNSPTVKSINKLDAKLIKLSDSNKRYDLSVLISECADYRRRIGFSVQPENAEAYLLELFSIYSHHYNLARANGGHRQKKSRARTIFIDRDAGSYTRADFKRFPPTEKLKLIELWFRERYENPVNEMPRLDGEYLYLWGGPFEVTEVLQEEFNGLISFDLLQGLIKKLEQESSEWAPTSAYQDQPGEAFNAPTKIRSASENQLRDQINAQLNRLEAHIRSYRPIYSPLLGHNHPPESLDDETRTVLEPLSVGITALKNELANSVPSASKVAKYANKLAEIGRQITGWFARKVDLAAEEAAKEIGKRAVQGIFWYEVVKQINSIGHSLQQWLTLSGHG